MSRGKPIDVDKLHTFFYEKADRYGTLQITQRDLASQMGVAYETICRVVKKMSNEGRMKRMKSKKNNVGVYLIQDPGEWAKRRKALGH